MDLSKIGKCELCVLEKQVRFNDVVAPEEMMGYVQGKAAKA